MNARQQNLIIKAGNKCRTLLDMLSEIEQIDILYNGDPDWDSLITDETIGQVGVFAAAQLTAQNVADAIFTLKTVRAAVLSNLPPIVVMANLR